MDLILLQFGEEDFANSSWRSGGPISDENRTALVNSPLGVDLNPDNCTELVSIHQGIRQQVTTDVSNSARTSGRPVISEFTCVKYVDPNSPKMYDYCLRARTLDSEATRPTMIFVLRNSGGQFSLVMQYELRNALISEIQFQSHPDDAPTEQFKLNFTEIIWRHQAGDKDLNTEGTVSAGWSVARNRPINPDYS